MFNSDISPLNASILSFEISSSAMSDDDMDRHIDSVLNRATGSLTDPVPCFPYGNCEIDTDNQCNTFRGIQAL